MILNDYAGQVCEAVLARLEVPGFRAYTPAEGRYGWGNALSNWFKARPMADQARLAAVIEPQLGIGHGFRPTAMMSLDEARQIAGLHEIGAHSFEHANLGHEDDDYVAADARRCREWFADRLGLDATIYAVPNGDYRERQLALIEEAGFGTILLVGQRFSAAGRRHHYRFNFDAARTAEMRFKALGGRAPVSLPS